MTVIKRFWDALAFGGLLIGLIYIPADLYGLPDAYPWLRTVATMVDRSDLILAFAILAVAYIIWMDARPFLSRFKENRTRKRLSTLGQECINLSREILSADKRQNKYEHHRALLQPIFWELHKSGIRFPTYDDSLTDAANANAAAKFLASTGQFLKNGRLEEAREFAQERAIAEVRKRRLPKGTGEEGPHSLFRPPPLEGRVRGGGQQAV
ncbi:hypothetical protein [Chelativorans salis]|uniref:Uncharacterized protein n=1 Tax=Chelativorans salis TaxID=2978478 RepID=A0ABT2LJ42_9HYPH|nr:hypothetical protein [Chelativorans sp. EGI FJ00035]MCT7374417.1 hypothetical protein [Chelativorans sp. EGI FJ00035]